MAVVETEHEAHDDHHDHGEFIAHHFDSAEQQFDSGKLAFQKIDDIADSPRNVVMIANNVAVSRVFSRPRTLIHLMGFTIH